MQELNLIKKIIIIFIFILAIFKISMETFASSNINEYVKQYEILQSKESNFLKEIYEQEKDDIKIKNITKTISESNYTIKEIQDTKILDVNDKNKIYEKFGYTRAFKDNEYFGELSIIDIKTTIIDNGYYEKIDEKQITFNNYSENDLNDVAKEIKLDGRTYYLINVIWEPETTNLIDGQEVPILYKGTQIYQTINKIQNPNTYEITVTYSGNVEKIDTLYKYEIVFESIEKTTNNKTPFIISGIGMVGAIILVIRKNTYIYSKTQKGYKLIKRTNINNRKLSIDITKCKNRNYEDIYAIKIKKGTLKRLKGRTISLVLGKKKKDITLWNNYYEIKI